jgi:colanic acid biosynthesis protein WcaH
MVSKKTRKSPSPQNMGRLPDKTYQQILRSVPVATVDFILIRTIAGRKEFMLGKRTEEPYKNSWFVPGGRIFKGETLIESVRRNCQRELGIKPAAKDIFFIGCIDAFNPPKMGIPWHSIWHFYKINAKASPKPKLNRENAEVRWFLKIDQRWPLPVRRALALAGFED